MPESPIFRHRVQFYFIFPGIVPGFPLFSPALLLDLRSLLETRPIFSYLFWHRIQIPLAFSGSVPGSFSPSVIMAHSLSLFMVVGTKLLVIWILHLSSFHSFIACTLHLWLTRSFTLLKRGIFVDPQFYPLTLAFYPMRVTCIHVFIWPRHGPLLALIGF